MSEKGLDWEEVSDAAAVMFNIWVGGSELEWAQESWSHFQSAGLVSDDNILTVTKSKCLLIALACVYGEFCALAWDETGERLVEVFADDLDLNDLALGVLAAKANEGETWEDVYDYEFREYALNTLIDSLRNELFECLRTAYGGEPFLYARMFKTINSSEEVPEDEELLEEWDLTPQNARAFQYVMAGFREG